VAEAPSIPPDFRVSMWRTECYGTCPAYSVKVDATGFVEYEGKSHVALSGCSGWSIPTSSVAKLLAKCDEVKFFDLRLHCDVLSYDTPGVAIEVTRNGSTKSLGHAWGSPGLHDDVDFHRALDSLANAVDELLETSSRVRKDAEVPAKPADER